MSVLFVENLRFLDTTLRDGEQTPGVSLNPDQKLEIASRLADIGVDVIEAGSAAASKGECQAIRLISDAGLHAETCTYVRALAQDIDLAAERTNLEATDISEAVAQLNAQTLTLEAAQAAFARINRRTLLDLLS